MNEAARIGILGGTLDPIHVGHIDAALAARDALGLDRVFIIPAHVPPHRSEPATSPFHRFAMACLAVNGVDGLAASDLELLAPGPSYTADTLVRLRASLELGASQMFFITGADAFAEIETWSRYPGVLDLAHFIVVSRPGMSLQALRQRLPGLKRRMRLPRGVAAAPGADGTGPSAGADETLIFLVDAPTPDVSSTEIRRRIAGRRPFSGLVPPGVEEHIAKHALYVQRPLTHSAADHLHGQN
jgi:nicotinate-nucleotide adenylyltransferase